MSNADPGRARPAFQWLAQLFALMGKESKQIILTEEDIQEALKYIMEKNGYANVDEIKAVLVNQQ